jgi:5-deoxy-D-glucuronate isomerase
MSRQEDHQEAEYTDEVIVVQIGGFIHQLDVGEAKEKNDDRDSVFESKGDKKSRNSTDKKNEVGPFAERLDPLKSIV